LTDFVALYRGRTVSDAELVAVSAEPRLVRRFFSELLGEPKADPTQRAEDSEQPTRALEVVRGE
jgi:hypothetical protein